MADDLPGKPPEQEEGAPEWMVTFGDLMSLLLCFFVLLLSFSQMDSAKFKELAGSLEKAFGVQRLLPHYEPPKGMTAVARDFNQAFVDQALVGEGGSQSIDAETQRVLEESEEALSALLAALEEQGLAEVEERLDVITMRFMGETTFDSGRARIKPSMVPLLDTIGEVIGKTQRHIIVAGHTDNVPLRGGTYASNLELSGARAASVVDFFLTRGHVKSDKIATLAFGEYRPLGPNDSADNRAKNRRVEIVLAGITMSRHTASAPQ